MKIVYLAGKYRGETICETVANIRTAETWAKRIWQAGACCLCPHMNTALFDGYLPDKVWLEGDLELVRASHALALIPGWTSSEGARIERIEAEILSLPIFDFGEVTGFTSMIKWLYRQPCGVVHPDRMEGNLRRCKLQIGHDGDHESEHGLSWEQTSWDVYLVSVHLEHSARAAKEAVELLRGSGCGIPSHHWDCNCGGAGGDR